MADFAPYQDAAPEGIRALSPPNTRSPQLSPRPGSFSKPAAPSSTRFFPQDGGWQYPGPSQQSGYADIEAGREGARGGGGGFGGHGGREDVDLFETKLGLRMDVEACLAYLALPPAGAVGLLIVEHRSDYVRFHAYQSALLFSALFVLHILLSWSSFLSWTLFVVDLGLIGFLTMKAYRDAVTLDRFEVPFFGPLASGFLDDE